MPTKFAATTDVPDVHESGAVAVVEETRYLGIDADEVREFDRDAEIHAGGKRGSPTISRRKCMPSEWRYKIATIRVAPSVACRDRHFPSASDALKRSRRAQTGGYLVGRSGDRLGPFAQRDNDRVFGIDQILCGAQGHENRRLRHVASEARIHRGLGSWRV